MGEIVGTSRAIRWFCALGVVAILVLAAAPGRLTAGAGASARQAPQPAPTTTTAPPASAPGGPATTPQPSPVTFEQAGVTVLPSGTGGLRLVNASAALRTVEVTAAPAGFTVQVPGNRIGPGGTLDLIITAPDVAPGTEATVTVTVLPAAFVGPDSLTHRVQGTVTVVAPEPPPDAPDGEGDDEEGPGGPGARPLVEEWSVTSWRFRPGGDDLDNAVVPLAGADCDEAAVPEGVVGTLGGDRGAVPVEASCTTDIAGADVGARLSVGGAGRSTGDYAGVIDLAPEAEGGEVRLTARRTDYVLVPLIVLALGAGTGWFLVRRLGLLRSGAAADRRAWMLLARLDAAHRTFRAQAGEEGWASYSFASDAEARVGAALGPRGMARRALGASRRAARAAESLREVERATGAWELLAGRLAELDAAGAEVTLRARVHRPPSARSAEPSCLAPARQLLTGCRLTTDEAIARAGAIDAAAALCQGWLGRVDAIGAQETAADLVALEVDDLPSAHPDARSLAEARSLLGAARVALWEAESLDDLDGREVLHNLGEARSSLDRLAQPQQVGAGAGARAAGAGAGSAATGDTETAAGAAGDEEPSGPSRSPVSPLRAAIDGASPSGDDRAGPGRG